MDGVRGVRTTEEADRAVTSAGPNREVLTGAAATQGHLGPEHSGGLGLAACLGPNRSHPHTPTPASAVGS